MALAADGYGQFTTGEDDCAAALPLQRQRLGGVVGGDLAGFAFDPVAEHDAIVARRPHSLLGGAEGVSWTRDQLEFGSSEGGIAGFGRLVTRIGERPRHRLREFELESRHHRTRVGECGRIGHRRP